MVEFLPITAERLADLREKTELDESLQKLKHIIKVGWPNKKEKVPAEIRNYFHFKEEFTIQDGILFKGNRLIIPAALRPLMAKKVHSSHIGIEVCLRKAYDVLFRHILVCQLKSRTPLANAIHATATRRTTRKSLLDLMILPNALGRM